MKTAITWLAAAAGLISAILGIPASAAAAPATVAPYLIDARFDPALPGGLPQGGETRQTFSNNHWGYALTWFGLALSLAAVFVAFAWSRLR